MKARRDFTDEAEYVDYLKTYATIAAMQGLLTSYVANGQYGNHVNYPAVAQIAVGCANDVIAEIYK